MDYISSDVTEAEDRGRGLAGSPRQTSVRLEVGARIGFSLYAAPLHEYVPQFLRSEQGWKVGRGTG